VEAEIRWGGVLCFCCGFGGWMGERGENGETGRDRREEGTGAILSDGIGVGRLIGYFVCKCGSNERQF